jgi:Selenoprotein, putative
MRLTRLARTLAIKFRFAAVNFWRGFRQATGDAAYESYLRSKARKNAEQADNCSAPLSQRDFYLDSLRRKYSTINRCC